jgi:hypothetical protein
MMFCSNCGKKNTDTSNFCYACGSKLSKMDNKIEDMVVDSRATEHEGEDTTSNSRATEHERTSEEEVLEPTVSSHGEVHVSDAETEREELTRRFVGEKYPYYKDKWSKMDVNKSKSSFNVAAFFLSLLWLGYRKQYKLIFIIAGIYLGIDFLLYIFNYQYESYFSDPVDRAISIGVAVALGLSGNYLYKNHVDKKVNSIAGADLAPREEDELIRKQGGTSWLGVIFSVLILFGYGISSSVLFPSNLDYIDSVKSGSFYDYPTVTIEEAFEDYFYDTDWEYVSKDSPYDVVRFTGTSDEFGEEIDVEVDFIFTNDEEFEVQKLIYDGEEYTSEDEIIIFLDEVFE